MWQYSEVGGMPDDPAALGPGGPCYFAISL